MIFTLLETVFKLLRIIIAIYFIYKFFMGNMSEQKTLWYGIACLLFLI